ncbi:MAG: 50S ribosomal protein L11 methyltransferase [Bacteroidales bacterium]
MQYYELCCPVPADETQSEIIIALLAEAGFESFDHIGNELKAYIPEFLYGTHLMPLLASNILAGITFSLSKVADTNWNQVWESNYEPVLIEGQCYIKAPFHADRNDIAFQLIIEPKMSFGTAHHATTAMMISYCLAEDLAGKSLLDMGCGTAVLAILARMRGANPVMAIDNEVWAFENACENIIRNKTEDIMVLLGDDTLLEGWKFDVILANINRNILLNDMPAYAACLNSDGILIVSGFYYDDLKQVTRKAQELGLVFDGFKEQDHWTAARYIQKDG